MRKRTVRLAERSFLVIALVLALNGEWVGVGGVLALWLNEVRRSN